MQNVFFDPEQCIGCGACVRACPHGCVSLELVALNARGVHPAFLRLARLCTGCECCVRACPVHAVCGY
ncbi:MAG: 4Fe-4S binding protein [Candidatus Ventricola sp.]